MNARARFMARQPHTCPPLHPRGPQLKPVKPLSSTCAQDPHAETRELAEWMPVVRQVVARFIRRVPRCIQRDDLLAAGTFGLLDALRRREGAARGPAFEWYVRVRIRGSIVDELRTQDW